jgi:hypothetical protein
MLELEESRLMQSINDTVMLEKKVNETMMN